MRQFARALWRLCRPRARDQAFLSEYLSPAEAALFSRMGRIDQAHCVDVARTALRLAREARTAAEGGKRTGRAADERILVRAALLHDVGKSGAPLGLFARSAVVLVRTYAPALAAALEERPRHPLGVCLRAEREHAERGARLAGAAGCEERVVALIRRHHGEPGGDPLLALLIEADRRS